jgi:hypothetical protein
MHFLLHLKNKTRLKILAIAMLAGNAAGQGCRARLSDLDFRPGFLTRISNLDFRPG